MNIEDIKKSYEEAADGIKIIQTTDFAKIEEPKKEENKEVALTEAVIPSEENVLPEQKAQDIFKPDYAIDGASNELETSTILPPTNQPAQNEFNTGVESSVLPDTNFESQSYSDEKIVRLNSKIPSGAVTSLQMVGNEFMELTNSFEEIKRELDRAKTTINELESKNSLLEDENNKLKKELAKSAANQKNVQDNILRIFGATPSFSEEVPNVETNESKKDVA